MKIGKHTFETSNPDKVLFPEAGITKGDIIDYYLKIWPYIKPYLEDRPLALQRFPDGIDTDGFYQKETPDYFPDWIDRAEVSRKEESSIEMVVVDNKATLPYLANQGSIALHGLLAQASKPDKPDRMIFDLDPPEGRFDLVVQAAEALKEKLDQKAYVMTTGSRGMHVVVPLPAKDDFETIRDRAHRICADLADQYPDDFTVEVRKNKRKGRLFLDYLRNSPGQHSIIPYSLRAIEGAPIATPLEWDEINDLDNQAQTYKLENIFRRLGQKENPWKGF